ncbi:MAG: spermidine/putrescine ABC transporter permease component II [Candidatus Improbicoccus pseudotrichonymphae]|uniref:Spermidine/putrescine ABC transporter permease component II n=1 Tax=Candidatus Improbicoccus pseudotrichonymphae TaxID=3033792 RepID=A0AA48I8M3_9FIRM|nr:MAG: spermidine/putrescine ABC transporter permease component II [Candidatus Improbicoccus pseudotrichonymphae]
MLKKLFYNFYVVLLFFFLYAPIFLLILFSFNNSTSRIVWGGFTLKWYKSLFHNSEIAKAIINTVVVAVFSATISTVLSLLACVGVTNSNRKVYNFVKFLTNISTVSPEIVIGISFMFFFITIQKLFTFFNLGLFSLILIHSTFCLPYSFLTILPKFRQITPQIFEAACDLGATPIKAFFKVIVHEIFPGLVASAMLVFAMSVDDFIISYFTCGNIQTLSVLIYSMTRKAVTPEINALSSIMFLTILAVLIINNLKDGKVYKIKNVTQRKQ